MLYGHPNVNEDNTVLHSPQCPRYNCLAFAVHYTGNNVWPDPFGLDAWPPHMQRDDTVEAIMAFLTLLGFHRVPLGERFDNGYERVAIYANANGPTHAARQELDGVWVSKLGNLADVKHNSYRVFEGGIYGHVVLLMRRQTDGSPPKLPVLKPDPPRLITPSGGVLLS